MGGPDLEASLLESQAALLRSEANTKQLSAQCDELKARVSQQAEAIGSVSTQQQEDLADKERATSELEALQKEQVLLRELLTSTKKSAVQEYKEGRDTVESELRDRIATMAAQVGELRRQLAASEQVSEAAVASSSAALAPVRGGQETGSSSSDDSETRAALRPRLIITIRMPRNHKSRVSKSATMACEISESALSG